MIALSCENVSLSFGTDVVLDKICFGLNEGDKLGIVGVNGAGKSTLFKIMTGEYTADSGRVYIAKDKSLGFLDQNLNFEGTGTVEEEAMRTFSSLIKDEDELNALQKRLDGGDDSLAEEFSKLHERFTENGGYEFRGRVRGMLKSMGLPESVWGMSISSLSGGQKTRLAISCLLLKEPDILMLDEPTNHLDMSALEWLEDFIKYYRKTVLIISHDRYFLDRTANKILEIENCRGTLYNGNYTDYVKKKESDREIQEHHYKNQQKEIARIEAYIEQQRRWNREKNIIAAESREKQLAKMERVECPDALPDKIRLKFEKSSESGNDVLKAEGLGKSYGERTIFEKADFLIKKNDRAFIVGENGCGKSTLIKILMGKLSDHMGSVEYGYNVKIGYYDQENQQLDEKNTVLDELWNDFDRLGQTEIRNVLALFLFKGDDVMKPVSVLSGGEKARLTLAKLVISKQNLLILDEPTNHLDINSREALESALSSFEGTIIAVSHDRYFVSKLSTRILGFDPEVKGKIIDFMGRYEAYRDYLKKTEGERGKSLQGGRTSVEPESKAESAKDIYLLNKKNQAELRKKEARLNKAKAEAERTEAEIEAIDEEMEAAATDHVRLAELYSKKEVLEEKLLELYEQIEEQ
ncbi:MAG: ABC-F family ATP-binding cassette domain-containing protein [Ruminococcaceae bacterium]|nr:ABC-F family ATP-binding cassette domain-containing protein [Oscillospiraceae bacterium]